MTGDEDRFYLNQNNPVPGVTTVEHGPNPKIYAIDPGTGACIQNSNTALSASCSQLPAENFIINGTMPHPEDFDFIEGDFYGVAFNENVNAAGFGGGQGHIYKSSDFTPNPNPLTPDILITQEYPVTPAFLYGPLQDVGTRTGLYQITFNGGNTFTATEATRTAGSCAGAPGVTCLAQWEHVGFVPTSDITLTKSPKNATFTLGQQLTFTLVVTSTGPGTATNVVVNDPLPTTGGLTWTFDAASSTLEAGESCTVSAGQLLHCTLNPLVAGDSVSIVVKSQVNTPAEACNGVKINNIGTAQADGTTVKTDTGDYTCQPGSYTLTKNPKNATYNIGDNINFTMVVTSTGPGTANNVVLNDPLPTLGNLSTWTISSDPSGVCTIVSNTLNCAFGNLANGASRTVTVATNAAGGANVAACPGGVKLNNTATLTGTGLPTKTDTGDYICTPPGSYTLTKNPKNATYNIGDNINFTMVVTSTGPGTANNVVLNDPLPTLGNLNTWTISSDPSGVCTIVSNTLNCAFGNLANGASQNSDGGDQCGGRSERGGMSGRSQAQQHSDVDGHRAAD